MNPQPPQWFERFEVAALVLTGASALVGALSGAAWLISHVLPITGYGPEVSGPVALALFGVAVSFSGVYLAIRISKAQRVNGNDESAYHKSTLSNQSAMLGTLHEIARETLTTAERMEGKLAAIAREDDESAQTAELLPVDEADDGPTPSETGVRIAYLAGRQREVFEAAKVPLWALGDVLREWDDIGATGRWSVSSLVGAYRNFSQGSQADNPSFRGQPWVLVFENPLTHELESWRVYRGGKAKRSATVAAVPLPHGEHGDLGRVS